MPTAADRKCVAKAACRRPYFKTSHSLERCDKIREKREERIRPSEKIRKMTIKEKKRGRQEK